jgi:predicted transposase YdaD
MVASRTAAGIARKLGNLCEDNNSITSALSLHPLILAKVLYLGIDNQTLRLFTSGGGLVPLPEEDAMQQAQQERQRADQEQQRAEQERQRADQERQARLDAVSRLRSFGLTLEQIAEALSLSEMEVRSVIEQD